MGVAFSPDGSRIAVANWTRTVKVLDSRTGEILLTLEAGPRKISCVAFSPDGRRIATGSYNLWLGGELTIWDARTGQEMLTPGRHREGIRSLAYSPDGTRIATAGLDRTVKVWEARTEPDVVVLRGHRDRVTCVCYNGDGTRIASGSGDYTVKLWDARTGQELHTLRGHTGPVKSVAFSRDGRRLLTRAQAGEQRTWDVASGQPGDAIGELLQPSLSSPDGRSMALPSGSAIRIHRLSFDGQDPCWWAETNPHWHGASAREAGDRGDWFAAAFHLGRLLESRPWSADLHLRRGHALALMEKRTEAVVHYMKAVLLDPHVRWDPPKPGLVMPPATN
jgi:WD40 repeat protein